MIWVDTVTAARGRPASPAASRTNRARSRVPRRWSAPGGARPDRGLRHGGAHHLAVLCSPPASTASWANWRNSNRDAARPCWPPRSAGRAGRTMRPPPPGSSAVHRRAARSPLGTHRPKYRTVRSTEQMVRDAHPACARVLQCRDIGGQLSAVGRCREPGELHVDLDGFVRHWTPDQPAGRLRDQYGQCRIGPSPSAVKYPAARAWMASGMCEATG